VTDELWTDGSAGPTNPGPGGWAVVDASGPVLLGAADWATNNAMEGQALVAAMLLCGEAGDGSPVTRIYTDSQLWVNILTKWAPGWEARGWRKADGTEPANLELVQEALWAYQGAQCELVWVKGHRDNAGNLRADEWADRAREMGAEAAAAHGDHAPTTRATVQESEGTGIPSQEGSPVDHPVVAEPTLAEGAVSAPVMKFSNSELRAFKRCRRKWWLAYYHKLTPRRDGVGPLSIGNMIHHPLELYYAEPARAPETFDWETPLARHVEARLEDPNLPDHLHGRMLEDYELVKIMLRGYFEWLVEEGADSEINVLSAEREIEAYLGHIEGAEVWLIGKLDTETELRSDGRVVFMDHKSCQTLSDLPKTGPLDEQLKTYGLLQRMEAIAEGRPDQRFASGGMWNMLRKVKRTARSNPPFYGRASVSHNDTVYRNFHKRVWGEVTDILRVRRYLDEGADHQVVAYPNPTRDCSWDCPFFMTCPQFDDGSDVESVVQLEFVQHDPYERYTEVEKG